jgi:PhnB protein
MDKTEHAWTALVQPYLYFDGRSEEAIEFYRKAIDAEVTMLMRFKDSPEPPQPGMCPPNSGEKIMHASLKVGEGVILLSDGRCGGKANFSGFALALLLKDQTKVGRYFNALAENGQIIMPLAKTFFSPQFGMVADRFGVCWSLLAQV